MTASVTAKRICATADETDAFEHRRHLTWRAGDARKVKASANRRTRRATRRNLKTGEDWA